MDEEVRNGNWNFVGDEEMRQGIGGSYDKLKDLKHGQGALEELRNPKRECGKSVVGVLRVPKSDLGEVRKARAEHKSQRGNIPSTRASLS